MSFVEAYEFTQKWEGGSRFTQDPDDPGGATKFGVSMRFLSGLPLKESDLDGDGKLTWKDVAGMTAEQARGIYRRYFWDSLFLDHLQGQLAAVMFDTAVNCGRSRVVKWLQEAVRVVADGKIGPITIRATNAIPAVILYRKILDRREEHYRELEATKIWAKKYINGWLNRTNDLRKFIGA